MTQERANKVYDILVNLGGATELMREPFIFCHTGESICEEWRFQGKLGFGGKYYSGRDVVDCYTETLTQRIQIIIHQINEALTRIDC